MFIVYSKENCSQCDQAIMYLKLKGVDFTVLKLEVDFTKEDFIAKFPKARSFPMVLKDGDVIGGMLELKSLLKEM